MRTSSAGAILLLAACAPEESDARVEKDDLVECALNGSGTFVRDCVIEVMQADGPPTVVIRHPDGGFRRFDWVSTRGGPELHSADGVERAQVEQRDNMLHIAVGADRYRVPVIKSQDVNS